MNKFIRPVTALLILLVTASAFAEGEGPLNDKFYVALGVFAFSADTKLRLDGSAGQVGTPVDWERDLGLGDKTSYRIDSFWRFAERHKIRFMYFDNKRSSNRTLDRDLVIDGETFPVNAVVTSSAEVKIAELAYEYAFMRRDDYELSVTAGLHMTGMKPAIQITGSVNNTPVNVGQIADAKLNAPLPVLGVRGLWEISPHFNLDAHAQYFYISFNDTDGSISDYQAALTWTPKSWLGLGVGFNRFATRVNIDKNRFNGKANWTYQGPQLFLSTSF